MSQRQSAKQWIELHSWGLDRSVVRVNVITRSMFWNGTWGWKVVPVKELSLERTGSNSHSLLSLFCCCFRFVTVVGHQSEHCNTTSADVCSSCFKSLLSSFGTAPTVKVHLPFLDQTINIGQCLTNCPKTNRRLFRFCGRARVGLSLWAVCAARCFPTRGFGR